MQSANGDEISSVEKPILLVQESILNNLMSSWSPFRISYLVHGAYRVLVTAPFTEFIASQISVYYVARFAVIYWCGLIREAV